MELTFECQRCQANGRLAPVESAAEATCSECGAIRPMAASAVDAEGQLCACGYCTTDELYLQKDFPQGLGLAIVVVGFAISTVFWYYRMPLPAYAVLLSSALLDMVLYYRVPDVTICYRCLGQYRGPGANPPGRFRPFDLGIGERYRQERIRVEQLRQAGSTAEPLPPA